MLWRWKPTVFCQSLWGYVSFGTIGQGFDVPDPSSRQNALLQTPPKTNMDPENDGYQKESPLPRLHSQVPMLLIVFGGALICNTDIFVADFGVYSGLIWRFFFPGGGVPSVFSASRGVPRSWRSSHARCRLGSMSWRCRTCRWDRGGMVGPKKGATDLNLYKKLRNHRTRAWNMNK